MAVSTVQATKSSFIWFSNSVATSAFGSSVTTGSCIVACVMCGTNAADITSVTDTKGNTYTRVFQYDDASSNGTDFEIWVAPVTKGGTGNVVTAHDSGFNIWWVAAYEVSGLVTNSWLDKSVTVSQLGSGKSAPITVFSAATAQQPDLLVQMNFAVGITSSAAYSLTSGWSSLESGTDFTDSSARGFAIGVQVRPVTSTGTFSTQIGFNQTASAQFDGIMVALKGTSSSTTWNIPSTTLAGSSNIVATLSTAHIGSTSAAGASSLSVTVHDTKYVATAATGSSSMSVVIADKEFETVSIAGDSSATVSASATHKIVLAASGGSSATVTPNATHKAFVSVSGSSSLSVTLSDKEFESVTITGSSSITITPKASRPISAALVGSSAMTATLADKKFESVTVSGTSAMSAMLRTTKHLTVTFSGNSTLSAFDNDAEVITAHIVGASSFTALLLDTEHISAVANAASSASFALSVNRQLTVNANGASQMSAHPQNTSNPTAVKRTALIFGGDYPDMQQPRTSSSGIVVTQDYNLGIPVGDKYYLPL